MMTRFFNPFRRPISIVTAASWAPLLLFGSGVITHFAPAIAQQRLPDPQILDELPPPSSPSVPSFTFPASPFPPASPNPSSPGRELDFQAPIPSRTPTPTPVSNLYRVDIFGDSPLLLSRVQQIEPEAFVRQGEGVIQAGVFSDQSNAQSRVRILAAQGIRSRITNIAFGSNSDRVNSRRPSSDRFSEAEPLGSALLRRADREAQQGFATRSYFVVIPGEPSDLRNIAAQVMRLGVGRGVVKQREGPRGSHVAVGPFDERGEAERWSSYFRSVGMDARVYFGN